MKNEAMQVAMSTKKKSAVSYGVAGLLTQAFTAFMVSATDAHIQYDLWLVLAFIGVKVLVAMYAYDLAKMQGRNEWSIATWCFIFPSMTLLYLGLSKQE